MVELERTASVDQVGLMVGFIDAMDANANFDQLPVLQRNESQGLILIYPFPEEVVRRLAARTAVVSIEHVYPSASIDAVGPAHSVDAMSAVEHLFNLGHRRIAYVCDELARGHKLTTGLRHAGYMSGLTRSDLPYRADDVINFFPPMIDKEHLTAWVKERIADGVTAVITSIDRHGYFLWKELPKLGIEVPRDVSLVGIGGINRAKGLPSLTTWRCNYEMIAAAAFDAIKTRCSGGRSTDLYQEIKGIFIAGESSGPPRA